MPHELAVIEKSGIRSTSETGLALPAFFQPDAATATRVLEFFTANIRSPHTRKAYAKAAGDFAAWCEHRGLPHLRTVQPLHVAAYLEALQQRIAAPSVKVQLAALRVSGNTRVRRLRRGGAPFATGSRVQPWAATSGPRVSKPGPLSSPTINSGGVISVEHYKDSVLNSMKADEPGGMAKCHCPQHATFSVR